MRAIHAETLKTRLYDDGMLTGYLEEQINDCPAVSPSINSIVDEVYTDSIMRGVWERAEDALGKDATLKRMSNKCGLCAGRIKEDADGLCDRVDEIYTALRKGSRADFNKAVENYKAAWGKLLVQMFACAGFLQLDAEKIMREQIQFGRGGA